MRRTPWLVFILLLFSIGCAEKEKSLPQEHAPPAVEIEEENHADYSNVIVQHIGTETIEFAPPVLDEEAQYPVHEVVVGDQTEITGGKTKLDKVSAGDRIRVWVRRDGDVETATKIQVEE
ncbi:hypothetical protein EQV77_06455 [Halobacillus fulvus]|nr:hypothetical protein EQV77_06455 [Halobacillus fulvus]